MADTTDQLFVHNQLHVSKDDTKPEALGRGPARISGSAYIQGPIQFGNDKTFHSDEVLPLTAPIPKPEGTVMIGPLKNTDSPIPSVCDPYTFNNSWFVSPCGNSGSGSEKYGQFLANPYSLVVRAGTHLTKPQQCGSSGLKTLKGPAAAIFIGDVDLYGYTRVKQQLSVDEKADFSKDIVVKQNIISGGDITLQGSLVAAGEVRSNCGGHTLSAKKNFDIIHPTKEGWRLTHTCIEGPEAAVFFRGRLKNKNEIELPEYWKNLVDINTITVNLTPIGSHQEIMVKRWDTEKIYLQSKGCMPIDCFYYVCGERLDTEKLIPEYEGSIEDYPGDNSQRSIAGYHYDIKKSP